LVAVVLEHRVFFPLVSPQSLPLLHAPNGRLVREAAQLVVDLRLFCTRSPHSSAGGCARPVGQLPDGGALPRTPTVGFVLGRHRLRAI
jgi:hypothetical protein